MTKAQMLDMLLLFFGPEEVQKTMKDLGVESFYKVTKIVPNVYDEQELENARASSYIQCYPTSSL